MPISYNPGVTDRSGEIFADQAGQGFSALAAGLQKRMEEDDRLVQNAKIAESGVKTNPELLQRLGLTESQFRAMSAKDKVASFAGGVAGVVQEQQAMKARSEQRMADAQANMYDQHRQYYAQQDAQDSAVGTALKNYMQTNGPDLKIAGPPQAPQGPPPLPPSLASAAPPALPMLRGYAPQPAPNKADWIDEGAATPGTKLTGPALTMAQRLAASFSTPGLGGKASIQLMEEIRKMNPEKGLVPQFTKGPNGETVVTMGNNMSVQKPNPKSINAVPVMANGEMVGYQIGDKFHTAADVEGLPENVVPEPMKDTTGKVIPNMWQYKDRNGKMKPLRGVAENPLAALLAGASGAPQAQGATPQSGQKVLKYNVKTGALE